VLHRCWVGHRHRCCIGAASVLHRYFIGIGVTSVIDIGVA